MQVSQPIDRAFVEIEARGEDDAAREIRDALLDVERDAAAIAESISSAFEDAADDIARDMSSAARDMSRDLDRVSVDITSTGATISAAIGAGAASATDAVDDFADRAERDFDRVSRSARGLGSFLQGIGSNITNFFAGITTSSRIASRALAGLGIAGGPAGLAAAFTALAAAAAVLIPVIVGLGGVFLDLIGVLGLLPAAGGAAITVLGTLTLAFDGVSEAVSALAKGDLDKIDKALRKLSPSARSFVREIDALRGPLDGLRRTVQEAFFSQFTGDLTLLARDALPVLHGGLSNVSAALGSFVSELIKLLSSRDALDTFTKLFESTGRIIRNLTPSVIGLFGAILNAVRAGLPFLERFFAAVARGIGQFAVFLNRAIQTGEFNQFLEDALTAIGNLGNLALSVGRLLFTIFSGAGDEGNSFIQSLISATDRLNEFFSSAEGQESLQDMLDTLASIGSGLVSLVGFLIAAEQAWSSFRDTLANIVTTAASAVGQFFSTLFGWIQTAITAVGGFFTSVGQFFSGIGEALVNAYNQVVAFGGRIIEFFQSLPGRIVSFVQALPGMIGDIFLKLFDTVFFLIGFGIGTIVRFFQELPGRVLAAVSAVIGFVVNVFNSVRNFIVSITVAAINAVVSFFSSLPGRVLAAVTAVVGFVRNVFNTVRSTLTSIVTSTINNVVSFFRQLPSRVVSAIKSLPGLVLNVLRSIISGAVDIGRSIIEGVGRGISAGIGAVIGLAKRAAQRILDGMKSALGIESPSKLFRDEVGREISRGVAVGITAGEPDVSRVIGDFTRNIVPGISNVTNTSDTAQNIAFAQGAIQVMFSGSTNASDARAIGSAIGASINDVLMRRNTRIRVRTS